MADNIIIAVFGASKATKAAPVWRISRGMKLKILGLDLPEYYQVHFSNTPVQGEATPVLASSDTVDIPDVYFQSGSDVYAWVYMTPEEGVAYTVRMITIPVKARPDVSDEQPTPVQESIIDQAIAVLNEAIESLHVTTQIEETTVEIDHLFNVNVTTYLQTIPANGTKRILGVCLTSDGSVASIVSSPGSRVDVYGNTVWSVDITRRNSLQSATTLKGTLHVYWID